MVKQVMFTGGGTAGHVTPNIAIIEELNREEVGVHYIGSDQGIERQLIGELGIPYYAVATGKLRRYFSWHNFIDPFKILWGIVQAFYHLGRIKPSVVFSKGGFVAFPVAVAAWLRGIPVVTHESDLTPGLANRLSAPFARYICVSFEKTKFAFKNQHKVQVTGAPIRRRFLSGDKQRAQALCEFIEDKPCLMIVGGGLGATSINHVVRQSLPALLEQFNVIHLCGKGKLDMSLDIEGYKQFEYVDKAMADLLALAEVVISRSGANSVYELLLLAKPHIFIPLPLTASRGDQIHNANYFKEKGVSVVLPEQELNPSTLRMTVQQVYEQRAMYKQRIQALAITSGTNTIVQLLNSIMARETS